MSDISLKLYGVIALLVFLAAAGGLFLAGLASLIAAFVKSDRSGGSVRLQKAFAYFLSAISLIVVNITAFGILLYFIDSNADETNDYLDTLAFYAWLPVQPVLWFVIGKIIQKFQ